MLDRWSRTSSTLLENTRSRLSFSRRNNWLLASTSCSLCDALKPYTRFSELIFQRKLRKISTIEVASGMQQIFLWNIKSFNNIEVIDHFNLFNQEGLMKPLPVNSNVLLLSNPDNFGSPTHLILDMKLGQHSCCWQ